LLIRAGRDYAAGPFCVVLIRRFRDRRRPAGLRAAARRALIWPLAMTGQPQRRSRLIPWRHTCVSRSRI